MADPLLTAMQLGRVLQSARKARRLSQAEVGARLDLSQKRISAMERDPGTITAGQLLKLCSVLGLELTIGSKDAATAAAGPGPTAAQGARRASGAGGGKPEW
jgi:HTH-type transcriptional regulator/antitoxin HipB